MSKTVGILAYGSLIDDPGEEIKSATIQRIKGVRTPFRVEFARSSLHRDGAPTLVPVEEGGLPVEAIIFLLRQEVSEKIAQDMLWRRETSRVNSGQPYDPPAKPGPNTVTVERLENFHGIGVVLYTKIAANIENWAPQRLAELAIQSARSSAGAQGRDGISYLIAAKRNGTATPLMPEYEREILRQAGAKSLEQALERVRAQET